MKIYHVTKFTKNEINEHIELKMNLHKKRRFINYKKDAQKQDKTIHTWFTYHVTDSTPRDPFLRVDIIEMVLYELHSGVEISLIEFIWNVPSYRTELSSLLHRSVEESDSV